MVCLVSATILRTGAVLSVGGWYDAEDPMGPFSTFYETSRRNPENAEVTLCAGPWAHGQWSSGEGPTTMGNVEFFAKTEEYYREHIVSRRHPSVTASACSRLLYVILRDSRHRFAFGCAPPNTCHSEGVADRSCPSCGGIWPRRARSHRSRRRSRRPSCSRSAPTTGSATTSGRRPPRRRSRYTCSECSNDWLGQWPRL